MDKENEDGEYHPLMHLDVYYSNRNTFKIGCRSQMEMEQFMNLLDLNSDCYYLS